MKSPSSLFIERLSSGGRAVALQVALEGAPVFDLAEALDLARSAGLCVVGQMAAARRRQHPRWLVGRGKVDEIQAFLERQGADLLLVNNDLTAGQQRNLEQALACRVMSRAELIIHIFAKRARTFEGRLQVELAQLRHAQTRLVRGWSHLDRQKGGIGLRGAGEKQLELDHRMLEVRIKAVQGRLGQVVRQRGRSRRQRRRSGTPTVALVGYTNAGKSTLFNALTDAAVVAADKPFATLDPTLRRLPVAGIGEVVLADTVGFISHLPPALVDAFKATLEEVARADLLVHVMDATALDLERRIDDVDEVLRDLGAAALPRINVLNKCDLAGRAEGASAEASAMPVGVCDDRAGVQAASDIEAEASAMPFGARDALRISARTGQGCDLLLARMGQALGVRPPVEVRLPASAGATRAWLYARGAVLDERSTADGGMKLTVRGDADLMRRLQRRQRVA